MATDVEFWRQDPAAKVERIALAAELARRSRAVGLSVTAYILLTVL